MEENSEIKKLCYGADNIFILGFSFDIYNIEKIGLDRISQDKLKTIEIHSTGANLIDEEKDFIINKLRLPDRYAKDGRTVLKPIWFEDEIGRCLRNTITKLGITLNNNAI